MDTFGAVGVGGDLLETVFRRSSELVLPAGRVRLDQGAQRVGGDRQATTGRWSAPGCCTARRGHRCRAVRSIADRIWLTDAADVDKALTWFSRSESPSSSDASSRCTQSHLHPHKHPRHGCGNSPRSRCSVPGWERCADLAGSAARGELDGGVGPMDRHSTVVCAAGPRRRRLRVLPGATGPQRKRKSRTAGAGRGRSRQYGWRDGTCRCVGVSIASGTAGMSATYDHLVRLVSSLAAARTSRARSTSGQLVLRHRWRWWHAPPTAGSPLPVARIEAGRCARSRSRAPPGRQQDVDVPTSR